MSQNQVWIMYLTVDHHAQFQRSALTASKKTSKLRRGCVNISLKYNFLSLNSHAIVIGNSTKITDTGRKALSCKVWKISFGKCIVSENKATFLHRGRNVGCMVVGWPGLTSCTTFAIRRGTEILKSGNVPALSLKIRASHEKNIARDPVHAHDEMYEVWTDPIKPNRENNYPFPHTIVTMLQTGHGNMKMWSSVEVVAIQKPQSSRLNFCEKARVKVPAVGGLANICYMDLCD